jgi:glucose-6-phosphate-specific signal transduction histidine kinase
MRSGGDVLPSWCRHAAVALGYGAAYVLLRNLTFSHWVLLAGLRLGSLLLVPRRYWPALLAGEMLPLATMNYLEDRGPVWLLVASVPTLALLMPVVAAMGARLPGPGRAVSTRMNALLACALLVSVVYVGDGLLSYLVVRLNAGEPRMALVPLACEYFLGVYMGILVVVPPALLLAEEAGGSGSWRALPGRLLRGPMAREGVLLAVVLGALVYAGLGAADEVRREAVRLALFAPVVLFALRHGWRGAVVAGTAASVAIILIMPARSDPSTMMAEAAMAFALSTFLLLGARTSAMRQALDEAWKSLRLARRELYQQELRMRQDAQELEHIHATLHGTHSRMLQRLRMFLSPGYERAYAEELIATRRRLFRLADSLSPREWQRLGQPDALWTGPIAEVLEEAGVAYEVEVDGQLARLSLDVNLALYRLGCEAVAYLLAQAPGERVRLRAGARELPRGETEAELAIESDGRPLAPPPREPLLAGLGATGLDEAQMRDRARLYDGSLSIARTSSTMRILVRLRDDGARPAGRDTAGGGARELAY